MTKTKNIIYVLIAAAVFFLFVNWTINSRERSECEIWKNKTSIAQWQKDQCEHHNLPLTGKVRPETQH